MLPGLYDDERRKMVRLSMMLMLGGFAVLPLTAQSSFVAGAAGAHAPSYEASLTMPARLTFPAFSISRDPFVPSQGVRERLEGAAMRLGQGEDIGAVLPPNAGAAGAAPSLPHTVPVAAPILRAVILGSPPRALVEEDGTVRVLAAGDRIGDLRVTAIGAQGVTLSDGTHLLLRDAQRQ